ncbi:MAG: YedE-related selenium metabolism membrane protein [Clostridia bacterium]|nr:YedE-related selenium metabolism membrane protein [Clostridia bacterium]
MVQFGNPANMGFCIACFLRDTAGALGLHTAAKVQYIRPEIIGLVIGAAAISLCTKEFRPRGGSSPMTRFILGFLVMIGCLVFLGCPLRMVIRIGGGDLNAILGLVGFIVGIVPGVFFLHKGYSLKRTCNLTASEGISFSLIQIILLILLLAAPAFIFFSAGGPGSQHALAGFSLVAGIIVGILAQKTRLCMVGGIRDLIMFKENRLILGFLAILAAVLIGNACVSNLHFGFAEQPIAHTDGLWNFLGMAVVGFGSTLLGGCPLRQLISAGEGNADSAITILGLVAGAAFAHNFGLASSAEGATLNGKVAVIIALIVLFIIAAVHTNWKGEQSS